MSSEYELVGQRPHAATGQYPLAQGYEKEEGRRYKEPGGKSSIVLFPEKVPSWDIWGCPTKASVEDPRYTYAETLDSQESCSWD